MVNQVGHPSIVDIFETGRLDDVRPYIVMERLWPAAAVRADEQAVARPRVAILLRSATR